MRYEGNIYSPHIAGDDYILQCTIGCSHNQCTFCYMYKDKQYRVRELNEILEDIELAKEYYGDVKKVFLADGDALTMPTQDLVTILQYLYAAFPGLAYVGVYASAGSILNKSLSELQKLQKYGLVEAHLGVESGDEEILREIHKGVSCEAMVAAGRKVRQAGINLFITVILGLAGRTPQARAHARNTAHICNQIQPDYIGMLTIIVQPGTELYEKMQSGEFLVPTDREILQEMRLMIENMELANTGITSMHPSNCIYLDKVLPAGKDELLQTLTRVIEGNEINLLRVRDTDRV
ncbi:HpnJ: hopanoid biosynthesis associated radical SAM protein HpnJ [Sporomusa termitida]|uniref:HpnJ: hopanoid biosynthesis associated radical SAM protein HpnJ n=2 Tax=Sporomusa termitida TaxID=2377 RepID=A0A517DWD2_9FIRM|nr:HpnJ: hopanoid biosynthesis associated radical SAM protein HpnJ [Sporomusa termitida]